MPIEIKELHIKVSVTAPETTAPSPGESASGQGGGPKAVHKTGDLVAACVEQVMELLHNKTER